jgi:hypothetical protein
MRPKSLAEVARLTLEGDSFDRCLANFLDEFYFAPNEAALAGAPEFLASKLGESWRLQDAYLAATAEELARDFGFTCPAWTAAVERTLHQPWFASSLASLRTVLLVESPAGFRARNLFVSANALARA